MNKKLFVFENIKVHFSLKNYFYYDFVNLNIVVLNEEEAFIINQCNGLLFEEIVKLFDGNTEQVENTIEKLISANVVTFSSHDLKPVYSGKPHILNRILVIDIEFSKANIQFLKKQRDNLIHYGLQRINLYIDSDKISENELNELIFFNLNIRYNQSLTNKKCSKSEKYYSKSTLDHSIQRREKIAFSLSVYNLNLVGNAFYTNRVVIYKNGSIFYVNGSNFPFKHISQIKTVNEIRKMANINGASSLRKLSKDHIEECKCCIFRYICIDKRLPNDIVGVDFDSCELKVYV